MDGTMTVCFSKSIRVAEIHRCGCRRLAAFATRDKATRVDMILLLPLNLFKKNCKVARIGQSTARGRRLTKLPEEILWSDLQLNKKDTPLCHWYSYSVAKCGTF
jgi:hypothetical protein